MNAMQMTSALKALFTDVERVDYEARSIDQSSSDVFSRATIPVPADWEPPPESSRTIETPMNCVETIPSPVAAPRVGDSLEGLKADWYDNDYGYDWGTYVLLKTGVCLERHESERAARIKKARAL